MRRAKGPSRRHTTSTLMTFVDAGNVEQRSGRDDDAIALVDEPRVARGHERVAPQLLDVFARRDHERHDTPLERERPCDALVVRDADDRSTRTETRDAGRRASAERRDDECAGVHRLRDVAGGVRDRLPDRRLVAGARQLVAMTEARLDGARDEIHRRDRLDRELADRRLLGQHHGRRAVENRVRHVARLRARRLGRMHHRLEHLRGGDRRLAALERGEDHPLLKQRHGRRADLDPEIPARDHEDVGGVDDRLERLHGLRLLDLCDHPRRRACFLHPPPKIPHVVGRAHERQRDEVDADLEREGEIHEILLRQRRDRHRHAREVHALVRLHDPADDHRAHSSSLLDALHPEPDVAVVDQHVVTRVQHLARRPPAQSAGRLQRPRRLR